MPLDVQPLSRTRRAFMLATLILLFAASLAFAQFLVRRHPATGLSVTWNIPKDFTRALPKGDQPEGLDFIALGAVNGHEREIRGIFTTFAGNTSDPNHLLEARQLFTETFGADATLERSATLAHRPAIEIETTQEDGQFDILRMVVVQSDAVAFCYSGAAPITDGDRLFLNQLCTRVEIKNTPSPSGK